MLPLKNLSADPQQEYFVDGMTESLIIGLAKASDAVQGRHLQAACRQRLPEMIGIAVDPIFDGIRRARECEDLLLEIGLRG